MTCGDRDKNALYGDIAPGGTDFLKFAYLISTKDNVFTVTYSLGIYTLFAKRTHPLGRCGCRCIQSLAVVQLLSLAGRSDQTHSLLSPVPPHSEVLSLPAKFLMCCQQYAAFSTVLYTALLSRTGPYERTRSGYFQGQII